MMPRPLIWLSQPLEAVAQAELTAFADCVSPDDGTPLETCDAALVTLRERFDASRLLALKGTRLKIIAQHGVGYDNIDTVAATEAGIWVSNTPDVLTQDSAELTWALLLAVARRVVSGDALARSGQWLGWAPTHHLGMRVSGKTLGIIGAGRIGQAVGRIAKGFGMQILYHNRHPHVGFERETGAQWSALEPLLRQSDFISLHLPGGAETFHFLKAHHLACLQPHAIVINTGRGNAIDENALINALIEGRLAGAGLDVFEQEPVIPERLRQLSQVVMTPHIASATHEARKAMGLMALANVQAVLAGHAPPQAVNTLCI